MKSPETMTTWERQAHWAELGPFAYQYPDGAYPDDWLELARTIMRRARSNVEVIVSWLQASGYRFAYPESAYRPPPRDLAEQIRAFEALGFHVPLSLRVWWEEVGSVNLMGTHPDWPQDGYRFESNDVWETDPLVVEVEGLTEEYENWKYNRDEMGEDCIGPFRIAIAPDAIHKANFSGGVPWEMCCDSPAVDSIVLNERHCVGFVAYLRIAFQWAGFPGFECIPDAPMKFLKELTGRLQPL